MTPEKYEDIKKAYIEYITDLMTDMGSLYPHVTVFADQKKPKNEDEKKPAIIHIPIPEQLIDTDEGKETFVSEILPEVFKKLKEDFIPSGVAWASEAWMRIIEKHDEMPENYKDIPISKEVIILTIDTATDENEELFIYEVKRDGKQVNQFGDFVDKVELILQPELSKGYDRMKGRFSKLFKKFNN